jgi:hypothetical protein
LQQTDWIAESNGAWDNESYWSNGVPSSTVAAVIAASGSIVSITSTTAQAYSLTLSDPPPLKWSDLRYVFDIKEDRNGKEAIQA